MGERLLPVHCCCEPGKRLGWVPEHPGVTLVCYVMPGPCEALGGDVPAQRETITLRKRPLQLSGSERILAYDSGHQPLEVLRTLPGWRDA